MGISKPYNGIKTHVQWTLNGLDYFERSCGLTKTQGGMHMMSYQMKRYGHNEKLHRGVCRKSGATWLLRQSNKKLSLLAIMMVGRTNSLTEVEPRWKFVESVYFEMLLGVTRVWLKPKPTRLRKIKLNQNLVGF